ncbi:MAG: lytic murein transglycosylase [Pseudomonadota bacterium]
MDTGIWGVDTISGKRPGSLRVIDSLATLGFRGKRRQKFFRNELAEFLLLSRDESISLPETIGSYAGAMGIPQFIPSSYRAYSVDFDGDGRRDLIASVDDAIGSVANYLARHGWRRMGLVAVPAEISGTAPTYKDGIKPNVTIANLRQAGVRVASEIAGTEKGRLLHFRQKSGRDYWVGFKNFYVISRYNRSKLYSLAVFQLATGIKTAYHRDK